MFSDLHQSTTFVGRFPCFTILLFSGWLKKVEVLSFPFAPDTRKSIATFERSRAALFCSSDMSSFRMKMSMEMGGMMLIGENGSARIKTCATASLSTTKWQWCRFLFAQIIYIKCQVVSHWELLLYHKDQSVNAVYWYNQCWPRKSPEGHTRHCMAKYGVV